MVPLLQLRQKKGELVTVVSVQKATFAAHRTARDAFNNLPARLCGLLAAEHDQAKIFALLTREIHQILEELSHAPSTE